jgi:hypothetical protein
MAGTESGHRAEVAGWIGRDVHLRWHRPFPPRIGHECGANRVDGLLRRNRGLDVRRCEKRDFHRPEATRRFIRRRSPATATAIASHAAHFGFTRVTLS